jgi:hypothetical protein
MNEGVNQSFLRRLGNLGFYLGEHLETDVSGMLRIGPEVRRQEDSLKRPLPLIAGSLITCLNPACPLGGVGPLRSEM